MDLKYQLSWHELAHRLIDDLIQAPGAGLPGIQTMRKKYQVSRLTVERALQHLEELSIVEPAERRKKRQVNLSNLQRAAGSRGRLEKSVLFISDSPPNNLPYMARDIFDTMHAQCEEEGYQLDYIQVPPRLADLRSLLISLQPRGIILYTLPLEVAEVALSLNLPVIGLGTSHPDIPVFITSHAELFVRAFRQAAEAGHRRIAAPIWKTRPGVHEMLAEALEDEFSLAPISFTRRYNLPLIEGDRPQDFHAALQEVFRYTPPTCIILPGISQFITASSFFLKAGLRIPDEVSVILLSHDPLLMDHVPSIAHFTLYPSDLTQRAFRTLQEAMDGLNPSGLHELVPVWNPGESLGPPKIS